MFAATAAAQTPVFPAATPVPAPVLATPAPTPVPTPASTSSPAGVALPAAAAPPAPAWRPFQEMAFLTGSWTGGASLGPRFGGRVVRAGPELLGAFWALHGSIILAAEEGGHPEETLDEEGWFVYDRERRKYTATWFFSNGVSGDFDVELLEDGIRLTSRTLVNYEAGTRARMLFQKRPDGDATMNVDLAAPGKDFVPWLVSALRKK